MSRPLRFIPEEGSLVEITCRTDQGRFLLRPDPVIDDILLGVLGRAQRLYSVEICGFSFLSSHYHLLLWVPDARRMAKFMWYFQTNAAREVARLTDWPNGVWSDRYTSIPRTILDLHPGHAHAPLSALTIHGNGPGSLLLGIGHPLPLRFYIRIDEGSRVTALPLPRARKQLTAVSGPASQPREWDGMRAQNRF